jgi:hypothetical protein
MQAALGTPIAEQFFVLTNGVVVVFDGVLALAFVLAVLMIAIGVSQQ